MSDEEHDSRGSPGEIAGDAVVEPVIPVSASLMMSKLPLDRAALVEKYVQGRTGKATKVNIRFKSIGSAPRLSRESYVINSDQKFESLLRFLRQKLRLRKSQPLFGYINSSFAPSLDDTIQLLYQNYAVENELIVNYAYTRAFG